MKKRLNFFCVLMLLLMAVEVIVCIILGFSESAQAFKQGWEDGGKEGAASTYGWGMDLLLFILGIAMVFLLIRALVSFVRFILNVNRDKVFVWENVPLLRWTGWGILASELIISLYDLIAHVPLDKIYTDVKDDIFFSVFCLIVAEVFAIGLKLKEKQDLTI